MWLLEMVGEIGVATIQMLFGCSLCQCIVTFVHRQLGKFNNTIFKYELAKLLHKGIGAGVVGVAVK